MDGKILTVSGARAVDRRASEAWGIPILVLMENAGNALSQEALRALPAGKPVAVFCGKGNNGGDGFVAARHLISSGIKTDIFLAGTIGDVKNEARVNLDILSRIGHKAVEVGEHNLCRINKKASGYGFIIDALLGVGISGEVKGIYKELIGIINASKSYILSVDIPSGLDAGSGRVLGSCVKADKTVTFLAKKRGMVIRSGPQYCGRIIVRGLGLPFK
ncbi:MAG: NAD(P)H-hydrate epimerase [Candidatus Omnitrophota bacterium]